MVQSKAATVDDYLLELEPDRRAVVATVRETLRARMPSGYDEVMRWGMITYEIPLATFPKTYNKQPLMYCALAAQKRHYAVYLMGCYADSEAEARLVAGFQAAGKKLDRGKGCVRFRQLADLPLELIGDIVAMKEVEDFLDLYRSTRGRR